MEDLKLDNQNIIDNINEELKEVTSNLTIGNRVDTMAKRDAYISLNDHKDSYESNPKLSVASYNF